MAELERRRLEADDRWQRLAGDASDAGRQQARNGRSHQEAFSREASARPPPRLADGGGRHERSRAARQR